MAHHKSAKKRIKQDEVKTLQNKYYAKTMRNAVKKLRAETDKAVAEVELPKVVSMIDKLAKKNVIHKNKAANLKSSLSVHLGSIE
jgi:small subunit ribosomal protein S20